MVWGVCVSVGFVLAGKKKCGAEILMESVCDILIILSLRLVEFAMVCFYIRFSTI